MVTVLSHNKQTKGLNGKNAKVCLDGIKEEIT
jgi:hypothetical protein